MSLWYRNGTANVTNGDAAVTGSVDTYWQASVNKPVSGDIFTDGDKIYEIMSVDGDSELTLDRPYEGSSNAALDYAIIRTVSATTNTRIAAQVSETLEKLGDRITVSASAPAQGQGNDGDVWIVVT
jgi:hypothetical protein